MLRVTATPSQLLFVCLVGYIFERKNERVKPKICSQGAGAPGNWHRVPFQAQWPKEHGSRWGYLQSRFQHLRSEDHDAFIQGQGRHNLTSQLKSRRTWPFLLCKVSVDWMWPPHTEGGAGFVQPPIEIFFLLRVRQKRTLPVGKGCLLSLCPTEKCFTRSASFLAFLQKIFFLNLGALEVRPLLLISQFLCYIIVLCNYLRDNFTVISQKNKCP